MGTPSSDMIIVKITNDLFLGQFNGSFSTLIFCDFVFHQATLALFSFPSFHEMWCWLICDHTVQVFLFLANPSDSPSQALLPPAISSLLVTIRVLP